MFEITIEDGFEAAHNLREYKGKCEKLHGHNYRVRAAVSGGKTGRAGMLMDFTELKGLLGETLEKLDHRYLNEIVPFDRANPTAENIARHIFLELKPAIARRGLKLERISVWETATSCATYYEK